MDRPSLITNQASDDQCVPWRKLGGYFTNKYNTDVFFFEIGFVLANMLSKSETELRATG